MKRCPRRRLWSLVLLIASGLFTPIASPAASMKLIKNTSILLFEGQIAKGDFETFMGGVRHYKRIPSVVWLDSPGGDVETAMKFGRFFRKAAIQASVREGAECVSACFLMLVGAVERVARVPVGIHRPYYDPEVYRKLSPAEATAYFRAMDQRVREYLAEMDVPTGLVDRMMSIESTRVEYLLPLEFANAVGTLAPSHEEWLLARCGIIPAGEDPAPVTADLGVTDEQYACWNEALDTYQKQLLAEILAEPEPDRTGAD